MPYDDFFNPPDDNDRTVIKPSPGGSRFNQGQPATPASPGGVQPPIGDHYRPAQGAPVIAGLGTEINPLIRAVSGLFSLAAELSSMASHNDVAGLKQHIGEEIKHFDGRARQAGIDPEQLLAARYSLCSLLDEVVLNTPWGSASNWSQESLLVMFHQEAWGGEKFFSILNRICQDPGPNISLIEFQYLCISMGFVGKYRIQEGGKAELELLRNNVYQLIRRQRGAFPEELSPNWRSSVTVDDSLRRRIPLWVIGVVTAGLLLACYLVFAYLINQSSAPALKSLLAMGRETPPVLMQQREVIPVEENDLYQTLLEVFQPEIDAGILEVFDDFDASVVRIHNQGLFASGSDQVNNKYVPTILKIAKVLEEFPNSAQVVGHSDSVPIFTARFPSNWHLSQSRAEAVGGILLQNSVMQGRVEMEGRADNEPLVPNDTPDNRATNRRIEVNIFH